MALFVPTVRAVRANPFARRQRSNLENFLKSAPLCQWPDQLKAAWKILHVELGLTKAQARDVVAHSAAAAVDCAVALADRSRMISQAHAQTSVHSACETISNCIKRAPAPLRNRLDQEIVPLIESPVIDTEIIQSTFETASNIFGQFPDIEPSRAARRLIEPFNPAQDDWEDRHIERFGAVSDYEGLGAEVRDRAERALSRLRQQRQNEVVVTAADIFSALAAAIGEDTSGRLNVKSNQLIKDYTFDLAVIWRAVGLRPARARRRREPQYRGRFHRFADLVLLAVNEPWSRRHDDDENIKAARRKIRQEHAKLPPEERINIAARLQRTDTQWAVSEDHVRAAIRRLKFRS